MFGLENQNKKKKSESFVFELEKDLMDRKFSSALKEKIEKRVQAIKVALRSGDEKIEFDQLGTLLHGYASLVKVFSRVGAAVKGP